MLIAIAIAEGIKGFGRKKDSLELKAIKAQIKNDEKQKALQKGSKDWEERRNLLNWKQHCCYERKKLESKIHVKVIWTG